MAAPSVTAATLKQSVAPITKRQTCTLRSRNSKPSKQQRIFSRDDDLGARPLSLHRRDLVSLLQQRSAFYGLKKCFPNHFNCSLSVLSTPNTCLVFDLC